MTSELIDLHVRGVVRRKKWTLVTPHPQEPVGQVVLPPFASGKRAFGSWLVDIAPVKKTFMDIDPANTTWQITNVPGGSRLFSTYASERNFKFQRILRSALAFVYYSAEHSQLRWTDRARQLAGSLQTVRVPTDFTVERLASVLDSLELRISRGETIDQLHQLLGNMLYQQPSLRDFALAWLKSRERHPRFTWFLLDILRFYSVKGVAEFSLEILKRERISEETIGAIQVLRASHLDKRGTNEVNAIVSAMLRKFTESAPLPEGSVQEKVLSELIDASTEIGPESLQQIEAFWVREWSFKVRVRAMSAIQLLLKKYPSARICNDFVSKNWTRLLKMILSLIESYNISNAARALLYRAIDLYFVRLGPECRNVLEIVKRAPELKARLRRSALSAEAALKACGNRPLARGTSLKRLKEFLN